MGPGRTAAQRVKGCFWLGGPRGRRKYPALVLTDGEGHSRPPWPRLACGMLPSLPPVVCLGSTDSTQRPGHPRFENKICPRGPGPTHSGNSGSLGVQTTGRVP